MRASTSIQAIALLLFAFGAAAAGPPIDVSLPPDFHAPDPPRWDLNGDGLPDLVLSERYTSSPGSDHFALSVHLALPGGGDGPVERFDLADFPSSEDEAPSLHQLLVLDLTRDDRPELVAVLGQLSAGCIEGPPAWRRPTSPATAGPIWRAAASCSRTGLPTRRR